MSFLKAEWRKLLIANYTVDPAILKPYIPAGTELDLWNDTCYVSLVGFIFLNTRLMGIPIPYHRNFEEVNLRFYVRYYDQGNWKRGVVFIKEIVPKPALTFVANTVYGEHYQTLKMDHSWEENQTERHVRYQWFLGKKENFISVKTNRQADEMAVNSETEFITEHYWGYTRASEKLTFEYEVKHPRWRVYPVIDYRINVNFELIYGNEFKDLEIRNPGSVMLAEGSEISVENKRRIAVHGK